MGSGRLAVVGYALVALVGCGPIEDIETIDARVEVTPSPDAPVVSVPDAPPPPDALLLTIDAVPPSADAPPGPPRLRVTGTLGDVNLRLGPGLDYPVITIVPEGCLVDPIGAPESGWMPVLWRGIPGWIHGRYLVSAPADSADCTY